VGATDRDAAFWEERYRTGFTPWDRPGPARQLLEALERHGIRPPGRVLDLGAGTGRNARHLADAGFEVVAIDISRTAIEQAEHQDGGRGVVYGVIDALEDDLPGGPFDLVFDFGCWHSFDDPTHRALLCRRVADVLVEGGLWLSVIGCTDGPPRDVGPPRRSARDVAEAFEPLFEILSLVQEPLHEGEEPVRLIWNGLFRKR